MAQFLGSPKVQYFKTGTTDYLNGGFLYSYVAGGTVTPKATYSTISDALALTNPNTNPIVLDSRGEATVVVSGATMLVLKDSSLNVIWSIDNVDQSSTDIFDANGNELLKFVTTANAVNEITITNAATTNSPVIAASGGDTNVALSISSKGSGALNLDGGVTGVVNIGTISTGDINLKRNTVVTGTVSISGAATVTGALSLTGNMTMNTASIFNFLPPGVVMWKASTTVPTGWLECNGTAVSRTTYATLFADIGTSFGIGDGTTTFNLPAQARRILVGKGGSGTATLANTVGATGGEETHVLITAEMPAHTHPYNTPSTTAQGTGSGNNINAGSVNSAQTTSSTGGDGAHNNMQPSLVMMMIIKY